MSKGNFNYKCLVNLVLFILCVFGENILIFSAKASQNPELDQNKKIEFLQENQYLLGPGDILELSLFDVPEFSGEYKILNDGKLHLPLIGSILVNNLTSVVS